MKLLGNYKFQLLVLAAQLLFWPLIVVYLYQSGYTPYWFDNVVQQQSWNSVLGKKSYSVDQKHNPYLDSRFESLSLAQAVKSSKGVLVDRATLAENRYTFGLLDDLTTQEVPVLIDPIKTVIHCADSKLARLGREACEQDDQECLDEFDGCGTTTDEKFGSIRMSDTVTVKNVYSLDRGGEPRTNYTSVIYVE